jgi:hypothetical protein
MRLAIYIKGDVKRCTDVPAALRDAVALCREARRAHSLAFRHTAMSLTLPHASLPRARRRTTLLVARRTRWRCL